MENPKIAIIGAGLAGLSCAVECERLGVFPDVFERDSSVGWTWPTVAYWPSFVFSDTSDQIHSLSSRYGLSLNYINITRSLFMKSANNSTTISGDNLGYNILRGKSSNSVENQLYSRIFHSTVHFNRSADYRELREKYDHVVIATGRIREAYELGVWEEHGNVNIFGGLALGSFDRNSCSMYFNTDYAGSGYANIIPLNDKQAVVCINCINMGDKKYDADSLFDRFLVTEGLKGLEFLYYAQLPVYPLGRVTGFTVDNILLAGRAGGLVGSLIGVGGYSSIISGILAARAIIQKKNYDQMVKPYWDNLENISSFRTTLNKYQNKDFDKLISSLKIPGAKEMVYNSGMKLADRMGSINRLLKKI